MASPIFVFRSIHETDIPETGADADWRQVIRVLAGCGGGGDKYGGGDNSKKKIKARQHPAPPAPATGVTLTGMAATGAAFVGATVQVIDSTGKVVGTSAPGGGRWHLPG